MCFRPPQVGKPIKCPECGCMNQFTQLRCKKCGADLNNQMQMIKCPACGGVNLYDSDVCDTCGMAVEDMLAMVGGDESKLLVGVDAYDLTKQNKPPTAAPSTPSAPKAPGAPGAPAAPKAPNRPVVPDAATPPTA